jgi:hypothetical protein
MSADDPPESQVEPESRDRWPIGFLLLVCAIALYLGWRLVQGIAWVVDSIAG